MKVDKDWMSVWWECDRGGEDVDVGIGIGIVVML